MSRRAAEIRGMRKERARILREIEVRISVWLAVEGPTASARRDECIAIERMIDEVPMPVAKKRRRPRANVVPMRMVGA